MKGVDCMRERACPSSMVLSDLLLGRLDDSRAMQLEEHIGLCSECQRVVDDLVNDLPLTSTIRVSSSTPKITSGIPDELVSRLEDLASQFTQVSWAIDSPEASEYSPEEVGIAPPNTIDEVGVLGPYRLKKLLGAGGMGMVYLAEDTSLHRSVAIKLLRPHLARHPQARDGFLREARAMAALKHDNIVTVYQVSDPPVDAREAVPYLAMELLDGESLADWVRHAGSLPPLCVARLGQQAAQGLAVAHARGVLHRDIKPGNLWLEAPPGWIDLPPDRRPPLALVARLKILDFGLAQQVGTDGDEGAGFGTPAYMSPEHGRGELLTPVADLFSLGVVMYELVTGQLPFSIKNRTGLPSYKAAPDVRISVPDVSADLAEVIQDLLQLKPRDRISSARQVAERLEAIVGHASAETRLMSTATVPIVRVPRSSRVKRAATVILPFLILGVGVLAFRGNGYFMPHRPVVPDPLAGSPNDEWCQYVGKLPPEHQLGAVLNKLRELNPGYNGQASVQIVDGELRSLTLMTDHISDIRPLRACTHLIKLECNGSARDRGQLSDLTPLQGMALEELNCWWNRDLRDMSPVRGMPLKSTQFGETPIEDLSPFAGMPLERLCINGCPVRNLDIVHQLPQLQTLNCLECPISTIEPLAGKNLRHLSFNFQASRGDQDILRQMPRLNQINWLPIKEFCQKNQIPEL
jgi:serine/threonine protein kinase